MPAYDDDLPQSEKRRVVLQDADVRQQQQAQGSTYLDQYHSDTGGRFSVTQNESVTGRATPKPPSLPSTSPWSGMQPEPGIEPPLGIDVNQLTPYELEPSLNPADPGPSSSSAQQLGAPAAAPSSELPLPPTDDVEPGAGAPSSFNSRRSRSNPWAKR